MPIRGLHAAVDDGVDPESGQDQRQNEQHSSHGSILGAHRTTGPARDRTETTAIYD
jgi:hypothetical protein